MDDEELLGLWHRLSQDRKTQLTAILRYVARCDVEMRESPGEDAPHPEEAETTSPSSQSEL